MQPRYLMLLVLPAFASLALAVPADAQTAPAAPAAIAQGPALVEQLTGPDKPAADIDVAALRQRVTTRVQSRADAQPLRRPPVASELAPLPQVDFNVAFDPDTAVIRPQSYQMIGRFADALSDPKLRPYAYLIVDHTESGGIRANNLQLSQRRADAIRSALIAFRVAPAQLQAVGLGEEQLLDPARPTAPANARAQIIVLGKLPEEAPAAQPAKKAAPKKKRQ